MFIFPAFRIVETTPVVSTVKCVQRVTTEIQNTVFVSHVLARRLERILRVAAPFEATR
jgi:hypothetical protein